MYYKPKHYVIQEWVSPAVYKARGEKAWKLLDPLLLITFDTFVDVFGPCTVNNWHWGGQFTQRGLRSHLDYKLLMAEGIWLDFGMHELAKAGDCNFEKVSVEEARQYIIAHPEKFPHVRGIELAKGWGHYDVRNSPTIEIFKA